MNRAALVTPRETFGQAPHRLVTACTERGGGLLALGSTSGVTLALTRQESEENRYEDAKCTDGCYIWTAHTPDPRIRTRASPRTPLACKAASRRDWPVPVPVPCSATKRWMEYRCRLRTGGIPSWRRDGWPDRQKRIRPPLCRVRERPRFLGASRAQGLRTTSDGVLPRTQRP